MSNYDILLGAEQVAFNRLVKDLYDGIYPIGFKGTLSAGQYGYERVDYDIGRPPQFTFGPPSEAIEAFLEKVAHARVASEIRHWIDTQAVLLHIGFPALELRFVDRWGRHPSCCFPTWASGALRNGGSRQ